MLDNARVQSLIKLNLTKFFSFREHVTSDDELDELAVIVFKTMAIEVKKRYHLELQEYLEQVRETLRAMRPNDKRLTTEFWTAQAESGWAMAFPDEYQPLTE